MYTHGLTEDRQLEAKCRAIAHASSLRTRPLHANSENEKRMDSFQALTSMLPEKEGEGVRDNGRIEYSIPNRETKKKINK
jgi:hypothetical protein